jgi:DNA mismatch repair protein MutS2
MAVDKQTLIDLEFDVIRNWLNEYTCQKTAQSRVEALRPIPHFNEIEYQLKKTNEFLQIKVTDEKFPALDFEEIDKEIELIPIKNASISLEGFMRIMHASRMVNELLYFFDKRYEYPFFNDTATTEIYTTEIIDAINKVFDKHGNIKDDASEKLAAIRSEMGSLRKQINRNFDREVKKLIKDNYLGDTKETFINDRRVLTVLSQYKRKVPGAVVGSSNTGSLTYIEPKVNISLNNEMEMLLDDERKEIFRILQELRKELQEHISLITLYQEILCELDFINAKSRLALNMDAHLPHLSEDSEIELINVYHPILWRSNKEAGKTTIPQKVEMDKTSRMLVISGPNAGGKSITLKSIGLVQIMLQSGLLVPVDPNSKMSLFQNIISDIGDNQSIANELSTYSYRLKRMKRFLEVANRRTLILIDEFGTGSDPDLGGALAEAIFESLYSKKCFGVITTHYTNIKLKADRLRNAVNGSMLFNTETLEPLYQFIIGQPGSSFTFEVAKINGIPEELIDEAKAKLDDKKVKLDKLLSELQKEKNYLSRLNKEHIEAQELAQEAMERSDEAANEYESKLKKLKENRAQNERHLQLGKKLASYIDRYNIRSRKKTINDPLLEEINKHLAVEKTKIEDAKEKKKKQQVANKPKSKKAKKKAPHPDQFNRQKIKVGSTVKIVATKQTGVVDELSGENVVVSFGFARAKVKLNKLMWIK